MKTLWILSASAEAVPGILRAKAMGLHVIVSDANPNAPGAALADDFILASTYDIEATLAQVRQYTSTHRAIDGVIAMAADVPMTVASIANELSLPGLSIETARLASDKLAMKQCFKSKGIPTPWFHAVESSSHMRDLAQYKGCPLVIKPVDSRGARGVLLLKAGTDIEWAFQHARENSPTARVMVEEYIQGPQVSTESVIINGRAITPGFADRNYEFIERFAPYIIENGGHQPSTLSCEEQSAVKTLAEQAGLAMGIFNGIAKGDMVIAEDGPMVIEIAARLSGGWFSSDQIPLATGVDIIGAAIRLALGEQVNEEELLPLYQRGVAIRYFFPEPGYVSEIKGSEQFANEAWLHKLMLFAKPGEYLEEYTNHTRRAGCVITLGADRDDAVAHAQIVTKAINFKTRTTK